MLTFLLCLVGLFFFCFDDAKKTLRLSVEAVRAITARN